MNKTEKERKFGDVTIFKVAANGYREPKTGVFDEQLDELIDGLTAARDALRTPPSDDEEAN
jgi:hypothetical protein